MYLEPTKITDVYMELSKFHLQSLLGQKTPKIRITTPQLLKEELAIELENLDMLGIGIVNPEDQNNSPANCIIVGKMVMVPTINDEFGIVADENFYSIICDIIIDTEKEHIPIKKIKQYNA